MSDNKLELSEIAKLDFSSTYAKINAINERLQQTKHTKINNESNSPCAINLPQLSPPKLSTEPKLSPKKPSKIPSETVLRLRLVQDPNAFETKKKRDLPTSPIRKQKHTNSPLSPYSKIGPS